MSETVHKLADQAASTVSPMAAGVATADVAAENPAIVSPEADKTEAPAATIAEEPKAEAAAAAPVTEEAKTEAAPAATTEKAVEPISEGQLAYKGPGLVKSLIPSKKEFWLSDAAVTPSNLELYTRGEKPEIAHPVVAWASQTGRGLLFFNKKGEMEKTRPHDVLALYDATDLKKESPHSFAFKLHGHNHTFKATSDVERDGWYLSIEKAIELGKASKEETINSEAYKAELEKLNKPSVPAVAGVAAAAKSTPKKSTEVDRAAAPPRVGSDAEDETATDKKKKSRSTSRGLLSRLQGKKEEADEKKAEKKEAKEEAKEEKKIEKAEKKEEKKIEKAEKKAEKDEVKEDKKAEHAAEAAAPVAAAAVVAEAPAAASTEEKPTEPTAEATTESKTEEKAKPAKRGSIFGKLPTAWGSFKSPSKEKDQKEAELKAEEPAKDTVVSENAPQLPETTTTEAAAESTIPAAIPAVEEPATEAKTETAEAPKETTADAVSPGKEKKSFLSGFGGFIKRDRSVSPSANLKEPAKKEEAAVAPAVVEEATEPAATKTEEPVAETGAVIPPVAAAVPAETSEAAEATADKPIEKVEEPKTEENATSPTAQGKRQSVFGTLGRRASKAFRGITSPRKENAAPATTEAKEETAATTEASKTAEEAPAVNGESTTAAAPAAEAAPQSIGDVVPEAVNVGQPQHSTSPVVAASA